MFGGMIPVMQGSKGATTGRSPPKIRPNHHGLRMTTPWYDQTPVHPLV